MENSLPNSSFHVTSLDCASLMFTFTLHQRPARSSLKNKAPHYHRMVSCCQKQRIPLSVCLVLFSVFVLLKLRVFGGGYLIIISIRLVRVCNRHLLSYLLSLFESSFFLSQESSFRHTFLIFLRFLRHALFCLICRGEEYPFSEIIYDPPTFSSSSSSSSSTSSSSSSFSTPPATLEDTSFSRLRSEYVVRRLIEGAWTLLRNPLYVVVTLGMSMLYFVVTGIQFWVTEYMVVVLKFDRMTVVILSTLCFLSAPTSG